MVTSSKRKKQTKAEIKKQKDLADTVAFLAGDSDDAAYARYLLRQPRQKSVWSGRYFLPPGSPVEDVITLLSG
jgi:hypothetical protein